MARFFTHWGRVTHICVSKLTISDSDNGLSPGRRQAIIWINAGILSIPSQRTSVKFKSRFNIFIQENPFENVVWKMAAILSRLQCVNIICARGKWGELKVIDRGIIGSCGQCRFWRIFMTAVITARNSWQWSLMLCGQIDNMLQSVIGPALLHGI